MLHTFSCVLFNYGESFYFSQYKLENPFQAHSEANLSRLPSQACPEANLSRLPSQACPEANLSRLPSQACPEANLAKQTQSEVELEGSGLRSEWEKKGMY